MKVHTLSILLAALALFPQLAAAAITLESTDQPVAELLALDSDVSRGAYAYSNGGFVVAGAMLEELTGETWESLLTRRVLTPLGMTSTGFGAPGSARVTRGVRLPPANRSDTTSGTKPV